MEMLWILLFGILLAFATLLPAAAMKIHLTQRLVELRDYYKKMMGRLETEALDARFTVDRDGRVRTFNHRAEQLFGYHSSEIIGRTVDKVLHVSRNVLPSAAIDSLYKSKRSADRQALEVIGCRKDSSYFPMEVHISETGGYLHRKFYLTARDLSERERAAENEREMKFLAAMLQCAGAPILILNGEGQIERHNVAFEKISGYGHDEIKKRPFWELLLAADEWERAKMELKTLIARAGTSSHRMEWQFKGGRTQEFFVSAAGVPLNEVKSSDNTAMAPAAMLVGFQVPATAEMHSGRSLEEASDAAHEFAGVLATIAGKCELLLHLLAENDPSRRDVEEIRLAGERALDLSSQLMDASREQSPTAFGLDEVVNELRPMLHSLLGDSIHLALSPGNENPHVTADRRTTEHVILNLALNARDAMPEGGKLSVETSSVWMDAATAHRTARLPEGRYGVITITDSGTGTNLMQRARVFDPYLGPAQKGTGTAASLTALMAAIRQQGGNAVMQAIPSTGTSIKLYLPAAEAKGLYIVKGVAAAG